MSPSRTSRANALLASRGVPHQTTISLRSRRSRRPCALAGCEQQSATIALASQKATAQPSSRSAATAATTAFNDTCGRRALQKEGGMAPEPWRIRPAATSAASSASSPSTVNGTIFAMGRCRSRTMIFLAGANLLQVLSEVISQISDVGAAHGNDLYMAMIAIFKRPPIGPRHVRPLSRRASLFIDELAAALIGSAPNVGHPHRGSPVSRHHVYYATRDDELVILAVWPPAAEVDHPFDSGGHHPAPSQWPSDVLRALDRTR